MRVYGFKCKTHDCRAWIKTGDLLEDSPQAMHLLMELGADPKRIICSDCRQTHDYYYSERETLRLVNE
jgi:hypothetical protein